MKKLIMIFAACLLTAACAVKPPPRTNPLSVEEAASFRISDVKVVANTAHFSTERAGQRKEKVQKDIEKALRTTFSSRMAKEGYLLDVEITSISVHSSGSTALGGSVNQISGFAWLKSSDDKVVAEYKIRVYHGVRESNLLGALISAAIQSAEGYYQKLVVKFSHETWRQTTH